MVLPQVTVGAMSSAISSLNTIFNWIIALEKLYEGYQHLHETIQEIYLGLNDCKTEFVLWSKFWAFDESSTTLYSKELWGFASPNILERCNVISTLFTTIKEEIMAHLHVQDVDQNQFDMSAILSFDRNSERWAKQQELARRINKVRSIDYIRRVHPGILSRLGKLSNYITELVEKSRKAFEAKHGNLPSIPLSDTQMKELNTSILLQLALEHREFSKELYENCMSAHGIMPCAVPTSSRFLRIGMDLLGRTKSYDLVERTAASRTTLPTRYHLLLNWRPPLSELVVEGPFVPTNNFATNKDFYAACRAFCLDKGISIFQVRDVSPRRKEETWHFRLQNPLENDRYSLDNTVQLSKLLYKLGDRDLGEFEISHRIILAYTAVECGFLLAGTPWFSQFKSDTIERGSKDESGFYRYILAAPAARNISRGDHRSIVVHFSDIGRLLVEIGLGKLVRRLLVQNEELVFELCNPGQSDTDEGEYKTITEIKRDLSAAMGDNYQKATCYCLGGGGGYAKIAAMRNEEDYETRMATLKSILKDFYLQVYILLRDLKHSKVDMEARSKYLELHD